MHIEFEIIEKKTYGIGLKELETPQKHPLLDLFCGEVSKIGEKNCYNTRVCEVSDADYRILQPQQKMSIRWVRVGGSKHAHASAGSKAWVPFSGGGIVVLVKEMPFFENMNLFI